MCTVTFIPVKNGYLLTSSRDEKAARQQAFAPQVYSAQKTRLLYPKDGHAGGTWIAVNENGNASVLLNGAFVKHVSSPPYGRSRGLVFVEIISAVRPINYFLQLELAQTEPFTMIVICEGCLYECHWDGSRKHWRRLQASHPYIWSSVTLYGQAVRQKREQWFDSWVKDHPVPNQRDIFSFHQLAGDGDPATDLNMRREDGMLTVSITGLEISKDKAAMCYNDLLTAQHYKKSLVLIPAGYQINI